MAVNVGTVPVYPDGSNEAQTGWTQAHVMDALEKASHKAISSPAKAYKAIPL